MVQVLPYVGTHLERAIPDFAKLGSIAGGVYQDRKDKKILQGLKPDASPMELIQQYSQLSDRGKQSMEPLFQQILKGKGGGIEGGALPWESGGQLPWQSAPQQQDVLQEAAVQNTNIPNIKTESPPISSPPAERKSPTQAERQAMRAEKRAEISRYANQPQYAAAAKIALDAIKEEDKEEAALKRIHTKENEPYLKDLNDKQKNLSIQDKKFRRLENLFEDREKFPSAIMASLAVNREGSLRPVFGSFLSPEAQEAVKIIQDELSAAKDTFGARVTNFDVGQYLKRLPSLLNTPEGRTRVLRDLRLVNEINRFHNQGIKTIFKEHGGSGSIPYSQAEEEFDERYGEEFEALGEKIVNPEAPSTAELPDAKQYSGKKIVDEETGDILISNGTEWIPFEEEKKQVEKENKFFKYDLMGRRR